jgi:hypothetical protein
VSGATLLSMTSMRQKAIMSSTNTFPYMAICRGGTWGIKTSNFIT